MALWYIGRTLLKLSQPQRSIPFLRQAAEARPEAPEPRFDLGMAYLGVNRPEDAVERLRAAITLKPGWAEAWSYLGYAQSVAKHYEEAEASLHHALTLPYYRAETLNHLGVVVRAQGRQDEAIEHYLKAIELCPALFQAWCNLGNALKDQNKLDEALVAYRQALVIEPKNPVARFNQAIALLLKGELGKEAWLKYEYRWVTLNQSPNRGFQQPLWRGEDAVAGKSILLFAEQGLGDTIQFVRYAPLVAARGATVHLEMQPALKSLLSSVPGIASIIGKGEPLPPFDLQCPLLSLPFALQTQLDSIPAKIPYVQASADRVQKWAARFPTGAAFRVGVVWRGNPKHGNDANRSIHFETFRRVFEAEVGEFVCLQLNLTEPEAQVFATHPACRNPSNQIADFADTAAIVAHLDLVVAVDTSVAHLAGAMGKPVWLLLPFAPDWRWLLQREDSPWYPTMRLFRQPTAGDWDAVITTICDELRRQATAVEAPPADAVGVLGA
jgi:tetratricopeptide (TPR) repeat protein